MQMMRQGAGVTRIHKNKASIHKNDRTGHDLGSMVGEISPYIMFSIFWSKLIKNECMWVIVYTNECNGMHDHGETEKQEKDLEMSV